MSAREFFRASFYGVLMALIICIIYVSRAKNNRLSDKRLTLLVHQKFLDSGDGSPGFNSDTISIVKNGIEIQSKSQTAVVANITYHLKGIDTNPMNTTKTMTYSLHDTCGFGNKYCIVI